MQILIIDDEKSRFEKMSQQYVSEYPDAIMYWAGGYAAAIRLLEMSKDAPYDLVCFDHDLGCYDADGKELTGASVARWMVENGIKCKEARVHSLNPDGARNILSILAFEDFIEYRYRLPFSNTGTRCGLCSHD